MKRENGSMNLNADKCKSLASVWLMTPFFLLALGARETFAQFLDGACCLPNGNCVEVIATMCASLGGDFQGERTTCADGCPGACCLAGGGGGGATPRDCRGVG